MRYRQLLALTLVLGLMVVPLSAGANHDNGDGKEACNFTEICLFDRTVSERWTNHFWYDASYGTHYNWWDTVDNHYEGFVGNDMSSARNRDSSCDVLFQAIGVSTNWLVDNDGVKRSAPGYMDQKADLHTRVNCS